MSLDCPQLIRTLEKYTCLATCFSKYVGWLCAKFPDRLARNDLVAVLMEGPTESLATLEERLVKSCAILGISASDFAKTFGFTSDLLDPDPERVHDVLGEPLLVLDLHELGFTTVAKLPVRKGPDGKKLSDADFTAVRGGLTFAIELKSVRIETGIVDGEFIGDGTKAAWWRTMLRENFKTKIAAHDGHPLDQLSATAMHYNCDCTLFAVYSRRLSPAAFMSADDYREELASLKKDYPQVDYFGYKDIRQSLVVYPCLNDLVGSNGAERGRPRAGPGLPSGALRHFARPRGLTMRV